MSVVDKNKSAIAPITLTEKAAAEVLHILAEKNIPAGYGLRVGNNGGGCSGVSYFIGFDKKKEKDEEFSIHGITVYIEKKHAMFLWGIEIDFIDTAEERGFVFNSN